MSYDAIHEPSVADLGEITSVPKLAKKVKWSESRMRRFLVAKNEEAGGTLLLNTSRGKIRPRWGVSLNALLMLHPQFFLDPERQDRHIEAIVELINELVLRLSKLERRVDITERRSER